VSLFRTRRLHVLILGKFEACGSKQHVVYGSKEKTDTHQDLEDLNENRDIRRLLVIVVERLADAVLELVLREADQLFV